MASVSLTSFATHCIQNVFVYFNLFYYLGITGKEKYPENVFIYFSFFIFLFESNLTFFSLVLFLIYEATDWIINEKLKFKNKNRMFFCFFIRWNWKIVEKLMISFLFNITGYKICLISKYYRKDSINRCIWFGLIFYVSAV